VNQTKKNVNIEDLTLTNGKAQDGATGSYGSGSNNGGSGGDGGSGGAIYNNGNFTLTNTTLTNNHAGNGGTSVMGSDGGSGGFGGAIYNNGNFTLTNTTFTSNNAGNGGNGGFFDSYGGNGGSGGAICNTGTLTITNSALSTNNVGNGGSGYYDGSSGSGGAIYNTIGNVTVNFCRIINNTGVDIYKNSGSVNATDNWWGTNFNGDNPQSAGRINTAVNTWIILNISASPDIISPSGSSSITADLTHDNNGSDTSPQGHIPDGVPALFNATLGNIVNGTIINGKSTVTFTAGNISGVATINATVDNQTMYTNVVIGNDDLFISPTGNDTTGDGGPENPYQTINKALNEINPNGTIHLLNGIYNQTGDYNININMNITLIGASQQNTIVNATNQAQIFTIPTGVNLNIEDLTLTNGRAPDGASNSPGGNGGAINNSGTLTIINVTLSNNHAGNSGVYNWYGTFGVGDGGSGGAIFNSGNLTVTNTILSSNQAGNGGIPQKFAGSGTDGANSLRT